MATLARRSDKRARTTERKVTGGEVIGRTSAAPTGPKLLTRLPPDIGQHVAAYLGRGDVNPRHVTRPATAAISAEDSKHPAGVAASAGRWPLLDVDWDRYCERVTSNPGDSRCFAPKQPDGCRRWCFSRCQDWVDRLLDTLERVRWARIVPEGTAPGTVRVPVDAVRVWVTDRVGREVFYDENSADTVFSTGSNNRVATGAYRDELPWQVATTRRGERDGWFATYLVPPGDTQAARTFAHTRVARRNAAGALCRNIRAQLEYRRDFLRPEAFLVVQFATFPSLATCRQFAYPYAFYNDEVPTNTELSPSAYTILDAAGRPITMPSGGSTAAGGSPYAGQQPRCTSRIAQKAGGAIAFAALWCVYELSAASRPFRLPAGVGN